jgi:lipopolysaccharide exporter
MGIIIAPILTRLYSPADYGVFAAYGSVIYILGVASCFRYELSIVLPEAEEDAANLFVLSIAVACGMSLASLTAVVFLRDWFANMLGVPQLASWLWVLPIGLLASGMFQALNYWSTRRKKFSRLARRQVAQSFVNAGSQISAGALFNPGAGGLIGGFVLGQLVATGHLAWQVFKEEGSLIRRSLNRNRLFDQARRYEKFPRFSVVTALLNTMSNQLPGLMFASFFGPAVLGLYSLGQRMFAAPMGVIGQAIAQALYPRAAACYNLSGDLRSMIRRSYKHLGFLAISPALLLFIGGPWFFGILFGTRWMAAGKYMRYILPWLTVAFVVSPSTFIFEILNKQDFKLIYEVVLLMARISAVLAGALILKNADWSVGLYSAVGLVANLYLAFAIDRMLAVKHPEVCVQNEQLLQNISNIPSCESDG